mmetsp:Transcript_133046/g.332072  ORF Transcript_133046/g.332072 Transcript_133046/m.332072 type:complete len:189 (+) Transcript_133046:91-657(+)
MATDMKPTATHWCAEHQDFHCWSICSRDRHHVQSSASKSAHVPDPGPTLLRHRSSMIPEDVLKTKVWTSRIRLRRKSGASAATSPSCSNQGISSSIAGTPPSTSFVVPRFAAKHVSQCFCACCSERPSLVENSFGSSSSTSSKHEVSAWTIMVRSRTAIVPEDAFLTTNGTSADLQLAYQEQRAMGQA